MHNIIPGCFQFTVFALGLIPHHIVRLTPTHRSEGQGTKKKKNSAKTAYCICPRCHLSTLITRGLLTEDMRSKNKQSSTEYQEGLQLIVFAFEPPAHTGLVLLAASHTHMDQITHMYTHTHAHTHTHTHTYTHTHTHTQKNSARNVSRTVFAIGLALQCVLSANFSHTDQETTEHQECFSPTAFASGLLPQ